MGAHGRRKAVAGVAVMAGAAVCVWAWAQQDSAEPATACGPCAERWVWLGDLYPAAVEVKRRYLEAVVHERSITPADAFEVVLIDAGVNDETQRRYVRTWKQRTVAALLARGDLSLEARAILGGAESDE